MSPGDLDTGDPIVTTDQVAERAGIAPRTFHAYVARGHAPAPDGRVGRTPVWREPTITAWLEERATAPPPGPEDRIGLRDAADLAGISYRALLELLEAGKLDVSRVDGSVTARRADVLALQD